MLVPERSVSLAYAETARWGRLCAKIKSRWVGHKACKRRLPSYAATEHTARKPFKVVRGFMKPYEMLKRMRIAAILCCLLLCAAAALAGTRNLAVVVSAGSKLTDLPLADLVKLCKGTQKTWPDGKNFTLVMRDPDSPEMHVVAQKLFGAAPGEAKATIAKLNESRLTVKIVDNDEDLLRTVEATPGAAGIIDVYSINSAVKVLRVDGKLPFDIGYALKGN